jgi:hypothetical protein
MTSEPDRRRLVRPDFLRGQKLRALIVEGAAVATPERGRIIAVFSSAERKISRRMAFEHEHRKALLNAALAGFPGCAVELARQARRWEAYKTNVMEGVRKELVDGFRRCFDFIASVFVTDASIRELALNSRAEFIEWLAGFAPVVQRMVGLRDLDLSYFALRPEFEAFAADWHGRVLNEIGNQSRPVQGRPERGDLASLKHRIRDLRGQGKSYLEICDALADAPRPAKVRWRSLKWSQAYRSRFRRSVVAWIARACQRRGTA